MGRGSCLGLTRDWPVIASAGGPVGGDRAAAQVKVATALRSESH